MVTCAGTPKVLPLTWGLYSWVYAVNTTPTRSACHGCPAVCVAVWYTTMTPAFGKTQRFLTLTTTYALALVVFEHDLHTHKNVEYSFLLDLPAEPGGTAERG